MHRLLKTLLFCMVFLRVLTNPASAITHSITFINPGSDLGFWGDVTSIMREASLQLDMGLEVLHSDRNRLLMLKHANEIVARTVRPDYVIIVNELQQGTQLLNILGKEGIPVYFLLNTLSESQISNVAQDVDTTLEVVGSIIPENFKAGYEMLMGLVNNIRQDEPDKAVGILAILGDKLTPAALEREAGMRRAISELGNVELERAFSVLWDPAVASKRVSTAMTMIEFDAIWAANDALALASNETVSESCKDKEKSCQKIPIVGLNWSTEGVKAVKNGELVSTHGGHFTAGGYAIAAIHNYINTRKSATNVTLRMNAIDSSNVDQVGRLLGGHNWSRIDFNALANVINENHDTFDPMSLFNYSRVQSSVSQ